MAVSAEIQLLKQRFTNQVDCTHQITTPSIEPAPFWEVREQVQIGLPVIE
jgi:hypothetical protein